MFTHFKLLVALSLIAFALTMSFAGDNMIGSMSAQLHRLNLNSGTWNRSASLGFFFDNTSSNHLVLHYLPLNERVMCDDTYFGGTPNALGFGFEIYPHGWDSFYIWASAPYRGFAAYWLCQAITMVKRAPPKYGIRSLMLFTALFAISFVFSPYMHPSPIVAIMWIATLVSLLSIWLRFWNNQRQNKKALTSRA